MTLWLVFGGVAALLIYIAITRAKAKKAGRAEAEGEHLANYAEKIGEINQEAKQIDEKADKLEPDTDDDWDEYFSNPDNDRVRGKPRDQR